jgi:hypothetical protein
VQSIGKTLGLLALRAPKAYALLWQNLHVLSQVAAQSKSLCCQATSKFNISISRLFRLSDLGAS